MITIPQEYIQIAEAFDNLAIRSEQLCALSRVIEDAAANPNKDTEATKKALWLMSSLLEEHHAALESVQKQFLRSYQPDLQR